jgi:hypothetical protein
MSARNLRTSSEVAPEVENGDQGVTVLRVGPHHGQTPEKENTIMGKIY